MGRMATTRGRIFSHLDSFLQPYNAADRQQRTDGWPLPDLFLSPCRMATYRVMVMLRRTAIRSESGGCVLNSPENTCPALNGATMNNEAVAGGTSMGIRLL